MLSVHERLTKTVRVDAVFVVDVLLNWEQKKSTQGYAVWRWGLLLFARLLVCDRDERCRRRHGRTRRIDQALDLYRNKGAPRMGYQLL
jgi:hypothetical protein